MKIARYWIRGEAEADGRGGKFRAIARGWSDESMEAARLKAVAIARRVAERIAGGGSGDRYPYGDRPLPEPLVREFSGSELGSSGTTEPVAAGQWHSSERNEDRSGPVPLGRAIVTRNNYGALVLNTDRLMFVDVDRKTAPKTGMLSSLFGKPKTPAQDPLIEGMNTVTRRHKLAARLYETAAGYRLIITNAPFKPGSTDAEALLGEYNSDPLYVRLCRMQESFRARLTPKPWRCHFRPPPVEFPFETADARHKFENWEREYSSKAGAFATCRFVSELGSGSVDRGFKELIDYHDHETKSLAIHQLA